MSPRSLLILLIRGYQRFLSPLLGAHCRFVPSCSQYAVLAIEEWGAIKGSGLTIWRILRCQPFCKGGFDYPPTRNAGPAPAPTDAAREKN